MSEIFVGTQEEFADDVRKIVTAAGTEIGIFRCNDQFYAFENKCGHAGGPVCEGIILGKVEAVLAEDKSVVTERFSQDEINISCPWHGVEFDLATGACISDRSLKLRSFQVVQKGNEVYLLV